MKDRVGRWGPLMVAMVTPFDAEGRLDAPMACQLAKHLVDDGVSGIILSGTTGESATLSSDEKLALLKTLRHAMPDCPLILGVGSPDTATSVHLAREAEAIGADGVLVISPYYNKPNQAGLLAHFTTVAQAAPNTPVMLYNHPGRTGLSIESSTLKAVVAQAPNVLSIKDSSGSLDVATSYRCAVPELALYSGDDPLTLPYLSVGAVGVVSVSAHVAARQLKCMLDAWSAGDVAKARHWHERLFPLSKALFVSPSPGPVKAALAEMGMAVGGLRLPLTPPDESDMAMVRSAIKALGTEV